MNFFNSQYSHLDKPKASRLEKAVLQLYSSRNYCGNLGHTTILRLFQMLTFSSIIIIHKKLPSRDTVCYSTKEINLCIPLSQKYKNFRNLSVNLKPSWPYKRIVNFSEDITRKLNADSPLFLTLQSVLRISKMVLHFHIHTMKIKKSPPMAFITAVPINVILDCRAMYKIYLRQ